MNDIAFSTETIICEDCKSDFGFTDAEQEFYTKMGFVKPKRCKDCRAARKQKLNSRG